MRYGTYTCGLSDGQIEFGFTFGQPCNEGDLHTEGPCEIGDAEFDIVLGVLPTTCGAEIEALWDKYRWAAEAIVQASTKGAN